MTDLVASLSSQEHVLGVPACPAWTVQDLVAHHAAVVADFVSGSTTELGDLSRLLDQSSDSAVARDRDALTARQVHERRNRPLDAILQEWCAATAEIVPMLRGAIPFPDSVGPVGTVIVVNDIVVHEGDLHEALGLEPPAVVHATSLALAGYAFSLDYRIRRRALPALALEYDGKRRVVGEGDPAADVSADRTTLVRLMASRLTDAQILELAWRGDPTPYLDVMPEYGPARPS
jgi:uncharacterized protein (TIGR03083 family)